MMLRIKKLIYVGGNMMTKDISDGVAAPLLTTRDMVFASLFAVLTGVGANIRIPFPLVPLTLQTVFVLLAGLLLGSRRGALSMTLYMLLGLLGLPVFAGGGGFQTMLLPSFGFIVGFIPAAWAAGRIMEAAQSRADFETRGELFASICRFVACLAGVFVYDTIGVLWLYLNLNYVVGKSFTLYQTLGIGLFPFLLPDMIKLGVVVLLVTIVSNRIKRSAVR